MQPRCVDQCWLFNLFLSYFGSRCFSLHSSDMAIWFTIFRQNALRHCPYVMTGVRRRRRRGTWYVRQSYISRTIWSRIKTFYTNLHTGQFYNHTGYDVTDYFRLAVIEVQKRSKMPPPTAFGRILVARRFACPHQMVGILFQIDGRTDRRLAHNNSRNAYA